MREINPRTGKLTRLIEQCNDVWLRDAEFTVDKDKWQRWASGDNPHVRQFAEVRGYIVRPQSLTGLAAITFDPRRCPDFNVAEKSPVTKSPLVYIRGKEIFAKV